MKVLIMLGKNEKGKMEAVEENHTSWREAIERSPVGEFVVRDSDYDYCFSKRDGVLHFKASDNKGIVGSLEGRQAEERFEYLLKREKNWVWFESFRVWRVFLRVVVDGLRS